MRLTNNFRSWAIALLLVTVTLLSSCQKIVVMAEDLRVLQESVAPPQVLISPSTQTIPLSFL